MQYTLEKSVNLMMFNYMRVENFESNVSFLLQKAITCVYQLCTQLVNNIPENLPLNTNSYDWHEQVRRVRESEPNGRYEDPGLRSLIISSVAAWTRHRPFRRATRLKIPSD